MSTLQRGRVGEAKAMADFVERGYDVYAPVFGNAGCDFIVVTHDGAVVKRVEVKTTKVVQKNGKYRVELKSVRSNKTANTIKHFDASKCDYLVVYFEPEDTLVIYKAQAFDGKAAAYLLPAGEPEFD